MLLLARRILAVATNWIPRQISESYNQPSFHTSASSDSSLSLLRSRTIPSSSYSISLCSYNLFFLPVFNGSPTIFLYWLVCWLLLQSAVVNPLCLPREPWDLHSRWKYGENCSPSPLWTWVGHFVSIVEICPACPSVYFKIVSWGFHSSSLDCNDMRHTSGTFRFRSHTRGGSPWCWCSVGALWLLRAGQVYNLSQW